MEILSQHTVDIQQHCAVFDKAPVAFAMFRLIFGKTGEYCDYQMVYHNHALEKIFENIGIEDIIAELDKKDQDQRRRYGAHHAPEVQPSGLRL